jgi:heme A synthase
MRGLALLFWIYLILFTISVISLGLFFIAPAIGAPMLLNTVILGLIVYSLDGAMQCEGMPTPLSGVFGEYKK